MNLSQKYRPKTLDQIIGHERVVKELKERALKNNFPQTSHFTGPTGNGKTTLQRILAKTLTCSNPKEGNPCNRCPACRDIDSESFSLVTREYNCSNVSLDEMRELEEICRTKPALSTTNNQCIIIDELQELSNQKKAQKAILKIIEKKQKGTYFILGSMDDSKVDTAVKNRSVSYRLGLLDYKLIGECLYKICQAENVEIDEAKARILLIIGQNSDGSIRTAISYLERCIESQLWDETELLNELGIVSEETLVGMAAMILNGNVAVMDYKITDDLVAKLRWLLLLTYKRQCGIELNQWSKQQTAKLWKLPMEAVSNTIARLNSLQQYIYSTGQLTEFLLLQSIMDNKLYHAPVQRQDIINLSGLDSLPKSRRSPSRTT